MTNLQTIELSYHLNKFVYQRRRVAAVTRVTLQNERWRTANTRDVLNLLHELEEKGASLRLLEPAIETDGPMGRMVLTVLGMVSRWSLASSAIGNAPASKPSEKRSQGSPNHV
jgi:hypothetical protein